VLAAEVEIPKDTGQESEHFNPIGQVLLDAGLISQEQLSRALKKHRETGSRLGQILISMNAVTSQDVGRMLEKRLNVPYVSLKDFEPPRDILRLFTAEFIKEHRALPLEVAGESVRIGMCDPFDLKILDAIERTTSLKPVPCLILEDEFEQFVDQRLANGTREVKTRP
jgi:type IV pilus assembly protein PilB